MRRLITIFLVLLTLGVSAQERSHILKVYNWDDYIDPDLIEEFETWYQEQTGEEIEVMYQTFESDFLVLNTIEVGHDDWDVTTICTNHIAKAMRKGLFAKIDYSVLSETGTENWTKLIAPYFNVLFNEIAPDSTINMFDYVVPLSVGTTGMIYNKEYYTEEEVNTWSIMHDPAFKGKILLVGDPSDVFPIGLSAVYAKDISSGKMLISELSNTDLYGHENVIKVEQWLKEARPQLAGWDTNFGYSYLIQNRFPILISWNSNAISAMRESEEVGGPEFGYVLPKEGTYTFCDCLVIPKYAANPKAAVYWINFMCRPENVIRNMNASNITSPVADSTIFNAMSDEELFPGTIDVSYMFRDCPGAKHAHLDPTIYIDFNVLKKCFIPGDLSKNMEEITQMYSRVQSNEPGISMIVFEIVVIVLLIFLVIHAKFAHHRRMRMYEDTKAAYLSRIQGENPEN